MEREAIHLSHLDPDFGKDLEEMGLILDSSVLITAERRGQTVAQLLKQIIADIGDQEADMVAVCNSDIAGVG